MKNRPIRVITFDLDDTFWDAGPVLTNAEQVTYSWLEENAPRVTEQHSIDELAKCRWNIYKNTPELQHQISQLRIHTMQEVMAQAGYDAKSAALLAKRAFEIFINARNEVTLFDEVIPLLEALHSRYILGTLTNGNADISRLSIVNFFTFSYTAEQLNASKPSPELFIAAQQATNCDAHEIIHVGDHIEHDVLGAHHAGCHALWYNPTMQKHPDETLASMVVQSLAEIPNVINNFESTLKTDD